MNYLICTQNISKQLDFASEPTISLSTNTHSLDSKILDKFVSFKKQIQDYLVETETEAETNLIADLKNKWIATLFFVLFPEANFVELSGPPDSNQRKYAERFLKSYENWLKAQKAFFEACGEAIVSMNFELTSKFGTDVAELYFSYCMEHFKKEVSTRHESMTKTRAAKKQIDRAKQVEAWLNDWEGTGSKVLPEDLSIDLHVFKLIQRAALITPIGKDRFRKWLKLLKRWNNELSRNRRLHAATIHNGLICEPNKHNNLIAMEQLKSNKKTRKSLAGRAFQRL